MAFKQAKATLVSSQVLAHYNPKLPIKMVANASAYGVETVISHIYPDGSERLIAFALHTLSKAETNYAQIERSAGLDLWCTTISPVYFQMNFHIGHRP